MVAGCTLAAGRCFRFVSLLGRIFCARLQFLGAVYGAVGLAVSSMVVWSNTIRCCFVADLRIQLWVHFGPYVAVDPIDDA